MTTPAPQLHEPVDKYGGLDPVDAPIYAYAAAARYLRIPPSTVSWWVKGRASGGYEPVLPVQWGHGLSFLDLVELHAIRQLRTVYGVQLRSIRTAVDFAEKTLDVKRLLLRDDLLTDGGGVFIEYLGELVSLSKSGQVTLRKIIELFLTRVERGDDRLPNQFFPPFAGASLVPDSRPVSIDPRVSFGRPTIAGTGVHTAVVVDRVNAGESVETLALDYRVPVSLIESAVSYETAA